MSQPHESRDRVRDRSEIKANTPRSWYNLYGDGGRLSLILEGEER